jgi:hypothetical protein
MALFFSGKVCSGSHADMVSRAGHFRSGPIAD